MRRSVRWSCLLFLLFGGSASAGYDEGIAAYQRGDYATANRELSDAAKQGDGDAIVNLVFGGRCLGAAEPINGEKDKLKLPDSSGLQDDAPREPINGEKDKLKLLRQAAANSAGAKFWLAWTLQLATTNPDRAESQKLFLESAEGGYPLAIGALGGKYGTPSFDPVRSYAATAVALRRMQQNPNAFGGNDRVRQMEGTLNGMTHTLSPEQLARAKELTDQLDKRLPHSKLIMLEECLSNRKLGDSCSVTPQCVTALRCVNAKCSYPP